MNFDEFEIELLSQGKSQRTVNNLINCLKQIDDPNDERVVKRHIADLICARKSSHAHKTVNAVRSWGAYLGIEELTEIPYPKRQKSVKSVPTTEEVKQILECPPNGRNQDIWHAYSVMFSIAVFTGGRLGEIAKLTHQDIDWKNKFIYFYDTKTGDSRKAPIPTALYPTLKEFSDSVNTKYLFQTVEGNHFSADNWGVNFRQRLEKCGIHKRRGLTPHCLRHYYVTDLLRNGALLLDVQKIVGHASADTTAIYYDISDQKLHETVELLELEKESMPLEDNLRLLAKKLEKAIRLFNPISIEQSVEDDEELIYFTFKAKFKKKSKG